MIVEFTRKEGGKWEQLEHEVHAIRIPRMGVEVDAVTGCRACATRDSGKAWKELLGDQRLGRTSYIEVPTSGDKELDAINAILFAMESVDDNRKGFVLDYLYDRVLGHSRNTFSFK